MALFFLYKIKLFPIPDSNISLFLKNYIVTINININYKACKSVSFQISDIIVQEII